MSTTLHELIIRSGQAALALQREDGSMLPGHNGPWNETETPVRNTGHWLITFVKAHEITGGHAFLTAANRAADYLASQPARPGHAAFWHRQSPGKDRSNGLIGQAWTIEALAVAGTRLSRPELAKLAAEVLDQHDFDQTTGLWRTLEVDGAPGRPARAVNQQIWFAASASRLTEQGYASDEARRRIRRFLDRAHHYVRCRPDGILHHTRPVRGWFRDSLRALGRRAAWMRAKGVEATRAYGYHSFSMYGLALLKDSFPEHRLWRTKGCEAMWKPVDNGSLARVGSGNQFCYGYNPTGIEIAFALWTFRRGDPRASAYLHSQFGACFDHESGLMRGCGSPDPVTLAARIYEATRLPDQELDL